MKSVCVLICEGGALMDLSIQELLSAYADIKVTRCRARNKQELLQSIEANCPDVILVCDPSSMRREKMLMHLMINYPSLCIIVIGVEDNWIQVYRKQQVLLKQAHELIDLIRGWNPNPTRAEGEINI